MCSTAPHTVLSCNLSAASKLHYFGEMKHHINCWTSWSLTYFSNISHCTTYRANSFYDTTKFFPLSMNIFIDPSYWQQNCIYFLFGVTAIYPQEFCSCIRLDEPAAVVSHIVFFEMQILSLSTTTADNNLMANRRVKSFDLVPRYPFP